MRCAARRTEGLTLGSSRRRCLRDVQCVHRLQCRSWECVPPTNAPRTPTHERRGTSRGRLKLPERRGRSNGSAIGRYVCVKAHQTASGDRPPASELLNLACQSASPQFLPSFGVALTPQSGPPQAKFVVPSTGSRARYAFSPRESSATSTTACGMPGTCMLGPHRGQGGIRYKPDLHSWPAERATGWAEGVNRALVRSALQFRTHAPAASGVTIHHRCAALGTHHGLLVGLLRRERKAGQDFRCTYVIYTRPQASTEGAHKYEDASKGASDFRFGGKCNKQTGLENIHSSVVDPTLEADPQPDARKPDARQWRGDKEAEGSTRVFCCVSYLRAPRAKRGKHAQKPATTRSAKMAQKGPHPLLSFGGGFPPKARPLARTKPPGETP